MLGQVGTRTVLQVPIGCSTFCFLVTIDRKCCFLPSERRVLWKFARGRRKVFRGTVAEDALAFGSFAHVDKQQHDEGEDSQARKIRGAKG